MKLLIAKGSMKSAPVTVKASKSWSLRVTKKRKPAKPAPMRSRQCSLVGAAMVRLSFQDCGHALTAGGADRDQPAPRAALGELLRERRHHARAGGGERMAERDAGTLWV